MQVLVGKGILDRLRFLLEEINKVNDKLWINIDYILENIVLVEKTDYLAVYSGRVPGYIVYLTNGMMLKVYEKEKHVTIESIHDCICSEV